MQAVEASVEFLNFFGSRNVHYGHEETTQGDGGDGGFPRKQPRLPFRYSLNR
jgi:hypothetical protein